MATERERSIVLRYLSDSVSSVKGKSESVQLEAPEAFRSSNAAGELRAVQEIEEVRGLAKSAVSRIKKLNF